MTIYPRAEQFQALLEHDDGKPVVMVNLLRFRPQAGEPDTGMTGEDAYRLYGDAMVAFVEARGGRLLWSGRIASQVIGDGAEVFDSVALVEYPSRRAFVEIALDPEVARIGSHRAAGLEMQWLLACTTERS